MENYYENKAWYTLDQFSNLVYGKGIISKSCLLKWANNGTIPVQRMGQRKLLVPAWFVREQLDKGLNKFEKQEG